MVFLERLRQPVVWGVLGLALLAGSLAFGFTYAKYHALEFDAVDYSFYLVSAERIGHPSELQQLSINPHGYDIFRFYGTEGTRSLHQSIHFEPVKYLYALLLRLIDAPATLFAFVAFVCVLPLLYLVLAVSGQTLQRGAGRRFVLCLALLYALNPLLYLSAADDLRPFVFLPPLFLATFIAIRCKRPLWEQVFCLCLLLLVREEALFLGVILLGVASTLHARMRDTLALATPWLLWVCATTAFYWWDGYPNNVFGAIRHHLSLATVAVLGCVAIVLGVWYLSRKVVLTGFLRRVLLLSVLFAGVGLQFLRFHLPPQYLLLHPFAWLLWIILACLALEFFFEYVAYSERRRGESQTESVWWQLCKKYAAGTCILLAALFLFVDLFFSVGPYHLWQSYRAAAPNNAALFAGAERIPPQSPILVDTATLQVFYQFDQLYDFERLPAYLVPSGGDYPANTNILVNLLRTRITYVAISPEHEATLHILAQSASVQLVPLSSSQSFLFYKIAH